MTAEQGVVAGRYRIVREIARGGMGSVHEAVHVVSKKHVALKLLFAHSAQDDAARQRFLREASAPAQIGHEGIVEVYDAGIDDDGTLFVAMELLEGGTLRDRLDQGPVSLPELFSLFDRMLDPLAAAHAKGIIHRDLKPENVFLVRKPNGAEVLKILDFGIARDLEAAKQSMTQTGVAMGTPHYMAPEQAMSARGVVATADVWALGAMLYEALTGTVPFDGETASAVIVHVCTAPHRPPAELNPNIPAPLAALIDRCLSKQPDARPRDAGALRTELAHVASVLGIPMAAGTTSMAPSGPSAHGGHPSHPSHPGYAPAAAAGFPQGPYGTQPVHGGFGAQPAQGGFPAQPAQGSYGTQPVQGGFGAPPAQGGYATPPASGGFGAHPSQGTFVPPPMAAPPQARGGAGKTIAIVAGVAVLGLCGVCGVLGYIGKDEAADATAAATTGVALPGATPAVPTPPTAPAAAAPMRIPGSLGPGDRTLTSGEYADPYTYPFTAGQRVRIRATASKIDPYLIVRAPSGQSRDNDDVGRGETNAEVVYDVTETGSHTVIVTSARPGEVGEYELSVEPQTR